MAVRKIEREALEFILGVSSSSHPEEFAGILRSKGEAVTEILVLPGTFSSERSAIMRLHMLPIASNACGTVHSHPSPKPEPSRADLDLFGRFGEVHMIVASPYDERSWKAYDRKGNEVKLEVID